MTIIRPIKGLETCAYECLASTFQQHYPRDKLHVRFCISDRNEPCLPVLERLLQNYPEHDAQILVEDEDAAMKNGDITLGPNPKIRNMTRAYREAIGDIVWIIDCNVWVAKGVCGRMIARLEGDGSKQKNKFVHQLPFVVDIEGSQYEDENQPLLVERRKIQRIDTHGKRDHPRPGLSSRHGITNLRRLEADDSKNPSCPHRMQNFIRPSIQSSLHLALLGRALCSDHPTSTH